MAHFSEIGMIRSFGSPAFRLDGDIEGLAVSPDGRWVAVSTDDLDGQIRILDAVNGTVRASFGGTADSLAFADDETLWVAYAQLHRHRVDQSEPTFSSSDHGSPIAVSRPARLVAAACRPRESGDVDLLSLEDGSRVRTLSGPGTHVSSLSFSPDGARLAVGYAESAAIFDVSRGTALALPAPRDGLRRKVAFGADGRIFVGREASSALVISGSKGEPETWKLEHDPDTWAVSARFYAMAGGWGGIRWLDARSGKRVGAIPGRGLWGPMAFLSESRLAVASSSHLLVVDLEAAAFEETAPGHDDEISAMAITRDGTVLATGGGFDHTIHLWHAIDGTHLHALDGHDNYIDSLAFSPDGRTLASGGRDGALRLYDVATRRVRHVLANAHGHTDVAVAFSSRGDLATVGANGEVALRDPIDGGLIAVITRLPPASNLDRARIAFDATGDFLGCIGPREEVSVIHAKGANAGRIAFTAPATEHAIAFAVDAPMIAYREGSEVVLASIPSGHVIARRAAGYVRSLAFLPRQRLAIVTTEPNVELFDSATGRARLVSTPNRAGVVLGGANEDELFVGMSNGTAILLNVGATTTATLAALRAMVQRFGTTHQFVGYRDAPMPASAPDDPSTTIVTRGEVTIYVRIDAEDDDRWRLTLSLPKGVEPASPPPRPPPPPETPWPEKPWIDRALARLRRSLLGSAPPPPAVPSPSERTFVMSRSFTAPPSHEEIDAWLTDFCARVAAKSAEMGNR